jgi:predicted nucleic acid-binding protein
MPSNFPGAVVLDASVLVAVCAKEAVNEPKALSAIAQYSAMGSGFFAPGVVVAEVLHVLCRKLSDGTLTASDHAGAVIELERFATAIQPPPTGDASLVRRADAIRGAYSCNRSADGLYIALAEELSRTIPTELLTFDKDLPKQAARHAVGVTVRIL